MAAVAPDWESGRPPASAIVLSRLQLSKECVEEIEKAPLLNVMTARKTDTIWSIAAVCFRNYFPRDLLLEPKQGRTVK